MSGKKGKGTVFSIVIPAGEVETRKRTAPAGRVFDDARRKPSRRKPDYLADIDDVAGRAAVEE